MNRSIFLIIVGIILSSSGVEAKKKQTLPTSVTVVNQTREVVCVKAVWEHMQGAEKALKAYEYAKPRCIEPRGSYEYKVTLRPYKPKRAVFELVKEDGSPHQVLPSQHFRWDGTDFKERRRGRIVHLFPRYQVNIRPMKTGP